MQNKSKRRIIFVVGLAVFFFVCTQFGLSITQSGLYTLLAGFFGALASGFLSAFISPAKESTKNILSRVIGLQVVIAIIYVLITAAISQILHYFGQAMGFLFLIWPIIALVILFKITSQKLQLCRTGNLRFKAFVSSAIVWIIFTYIHILYLINTYGS